MERELTTPRDTATTWGVANFRARALALYIDRYAVYRAKGLHFSAFIGKGVYLGSNSDGMYVMHLCNYVIPSRQD